MKKSTFTKFFFILWVLLWILAFIFIPSRVDFIHGGTFGDFEDFPQKLESFNITAAITDALFSFCAASLLTLVYLILGSGVFRLLTKKFFFDEKISILNWLGLASTSFVLGHAVFSFIFILLGDKHLLEAKYIWMILLVGTLAGVSSLIILYKKIPASTNNRIATLWNQAKQKVILTLTAVILLLGLFYSATRLSYDAVAFYFSDEKLTSITGQIDYFQNDSYIASSFQTGITYAALITLAGDQAARMYSWVNGLVIILFSLAIGERLGLSSRARLLSIVLLLTSTAFVDLTGDGKIDIISTTPAIASIYWAIISITRKDKAIALLIGILAGISIVSRPFNAFLVCMFIGIYYTISFFSSENKTERLKLVHMVIIIGLGTIIPGISHLIVNQLILGDPLSFLHNVQVTNASNWQWTFDKDNLWIIRLLYPFALTIINIPQSNGNISPLFVAFLPALLSKNIMVKFKEKSQLSRIVVTAIITLFLWNTILFTVFEIRYVLFLWIILYIALAMVMEEIIFGADKFRGKFTEFTAILVLLFAGIRMIYIIIDTYSPVDKTNTPHCTDHDLCAILDPINENANAGERVFTLSAFRYYLRPDLLACSSKHDDYQKLQQLANTEPRQFWSELHRLGFQYITFEPRYSKIHLGFDLSLENENIPEWMELKPLLTLPAEYASYKIITRNPPVATQKTCTQNLAGQWEIIDIAK